MMVKFVKQVFIALLNFSGLLAHVAKVFNGTKCISLDNELGVARSNLIDFNKNEYF